MNDHKIQAKNSTYSHAFKTYMQKLKAQKESFFKKKACQEVLDALLIYEYEIETRDDIRKFIHFMGKKNAKRTIQKFETIRFEGHLPEVTEYFEKNPENTEKVEALEQLSSIYGIGSVKAENLYNKFGIKTIAQLRSMVFETNADADRKHTGKVKDNDQIILTDSQLAGLKFYDDLNERIPRDEIIQYHKKLSGILATIDDTAKLCVAGSYRRGNRDSGDIDILLCSETLRLCDFTQQLNDITVRILANGQKKCMLLSKLHDTSRVRHMDIIMTRPNQFAFAQLYFTGSKAFNIKMRKHALSLGYSLNEYGLTRAKERKNVRHCKKEEGNDSKINKTENIPQFYSEQDVFEFLNFPFVSPNER